MSNQKKIFLNINSLHNYISNNFDNENGGLLGSPKFPMPVVYDFLLTYYFFNNNKKTLTHVIKTLELMALGGIYDQLGGGFFRYSTGIKWKVPHFEKMLYDNALLISLYSNAYKITKCASFKKVIEKTISFVKTELKCDTGLYYSAIDADSEGKEGKFYIWEKSEIIKELRSKADLFITYFQVDEFSHWENNFNILIPKKKQETIANLFNISVQELEEEITVLKEKLMSHRNKRVRPLTDTKILLSWNALIINAYIDAYNALGNKSYYLLAKKSAQLILEFSKKKRHLPHVFKL